MNLEQLKDQYLEAAASALEIQKKLLSNERLPPATRLATAKEIITNSQVWVTLSAQQAEIDQLTNELQTLRAELAGNEEIV